MLNKLSLRTRITLFTAVILTVVCLILTTISVYNAKTTFLPKIDMKNGAEIKLYPENNISLDDNDMIKWVDSVNYQSIFQRKSIIYTVLFVLIGSFIIWIVVDHGLNPLKKLIYQMEVIDGNNLKTNLEELESKDEIALLTREFNKMIDKINIGVEVQKRFSNNVSHELFTPITSIMSNIEVLEIDSSPTKEDYAEVLDIIKKQTKHMANIIKNLRDMNLLVNIGNFEIFDAEKMFLDIVSSYIKEIEGKNISIIMEGNTKLKGNPSLLERAFSNIIQNSIRYNNQNGKIYITVSENSIIISDTGIGIKKENIKHVFDPFYCEDLSRSKELGGSGLGLSITKQVLDRHNMDIDVKSNENGTSFKITF